MIVDDDNFREVVEALREFCRRSLDDGVDIMFGGGITLSAIDAVLNPYHRAGKTKRVEHYDDAQNNEWGA